MSCVLGIDLGTGSLKGVVLDKSGKMICESTAGYKTSIPGIGMSEQQPNDWYEAFECVLTELVSIYPNLCEELEGISFSGQMHSLVLLDQYNQVIRPSILWNDVRTTTQCELLQKRYGEMLLNVTQNRALEGFTLPKILWVKEHEPHNWKKVAKILLPKDYLSFCLTGEFQTDYSDASGTLLLDLAEKNWSKELLAEFDIRMDQLPKVTHSSDKVGTLKETLIEKYHFKHQVNIFTGGADNACAALSCGVVNDDDALLSIGTSGVFLTGNQQRNVTGDIHSFHHVLEDSIYSMGVTLSAGQSLSWFQQTFAKDESIDKLIADSKAIPIGANGLLFAPYIMGERTPYSDASIRGSFIGIDASHQLSHFTKAVIEGITFSLRDVKELVEEQTESCYHEIVSTGGGAKSSEWLQIQANVLNATIMILEGEQGPGIGAAMLAAKGLGWYQTDEELISVFVSYKDKIEPNKDDVKKYNDVYQRYRDIYPNTQSICQTNE